VDLETDINYLSVPPEKRCGDCKHWDFPDCKRHETCEDFSEFETTNEEQLQSLAREISREMREISLAKGRIRILQANVNYLTPNKK
jgi:hypothetical protein